MSDMTAESQIVEKFARIEKKIYMSTAEAIELSRSLGRQLRLLEPSPDVAIGLANGATMTTKLAAEVAGIPFEIVKTRRKGSRFKQHLKSIKTALRVPAWILASRPLGYLSTAFDRRFSTIEQASASSIPNVRGKTVVIIDDCIDTGSSINHVRKQLFSAGAQKIHVAVLCWSFKNDTAATYQVVPDVFLHRRIQYYPWSNNSPFYKEFLKWLDANNMKLWA